jgi:membrane protein implicated in regulation of membrane protease activity
MAPDSSLLGRIGVLTVSTRGATGPGEVVIKIRGGSEAFLAWSDDPLPKGTTVLVIHSRGARTVDVTRWIEPFSFTPDFPD